MRPTFVEYYSGYGQLQVEENLRVHEIATVTQANPMVLTTVYPHGYVAGMMVTFLIPPSFGMVQLNRLNVQVLIASTNTLTIQLDTTSFSPFAYPSPLPSAYTPPSIIPTSSGVYLPPLPLPYGNQDSFEGVIYNNGAIHDPINGM